MGIGERIRRAVDARKLTLKEAAKACGLSYSSLQNWVGGIREPRPEALIAIGSHLGVSIDWLLTGEGEMLRGEGVQAGPNLGLCSPAEVAVLSIFRSLDERDQRDIERVVVEKKRLRDIEKRLEDLTDVLAATKKSS